MSDHTTFDQPEPDEDPALSEKRRAFEEALLEVLKDTPRRERPLRDAKADAEGRADAGPQPGFEPGGKATRERILKTANKLVNGDRNAQYGDPKQDFLRSATLWNVYLRGIIERDGGLLLQPMDIAIMQLLLKVSRLVVSPNKEDHYLDIAGYAACAADCAEAQYGGLV